MDERLVYTNYMSLYDMPGAGVIDNNYLYYICLNNNKLIKYNLLLGEIEKVYYIPMDVTIFDMTGISETNLAAREVERRNELEKMFPMAVLKDYDAYHFPISQIQRLKRHHMWPLVYFVERVLFKLEKWGILK